MSATLEKALALATLGIHVFPCHMSKKPLTANGFHAGSIDPEAIRSMWSEDALVGYWTGASELVVLDIDVKTDNGYYSLWNTPEAVDTYDSSPVRYKTPSGGEHYVFRAPSNAPGPAAPIAGLSGVDRRSAGSYAIWYGDVPATLDDIPEAPLWLLAGGRGLPRTGEVPAFIGDIERWIDDLAGGEPDASTARLSTNPLHYGEMVKAIHPLVGLAVITPETPGLRKVFDQVSEVYMRSPETSVPEMDRPRKILDYVRWSISVWEKEKADGLGVVAEWARNLPTADFWERRPVLEQIKTLSRQKTASPWSLLGAAIQRSLHGVPFGIKYKSYLGEADLNTLVAFVGPTGGGKSTGQKTLTRHFKFPNEERSTAPVEPASGEAMPDHYQTMMRDPETKQMKKVWRDPFNHAQLFAFDEIGMLDARQARQGSTLVEFMKQGWSGEMFGRVKAGGEGTFIEGGQYRFGLYINVQPAKAGMLMTDSAVAGGLPSRFLWFNTQNPKARADQDHSEAAVVTLPAPCWEAISDIKALPVMDAAHREHILSGHEGTNDEMDSHALLTRAKVAVALMVLDGRTALNEEDWELSGMVMQHSTETRTGVQKALGTAARHDAVRAGKAAGERSAIAAITERQRYVQDTAAKVKKLREDHPSAPERGKGGIRTRLRSNFREYYEEACELLDAAR